MQGKFQIWVSSGLLVGFLASGCIDPSMLKSKPKEDATEQTADQTAPDAAPANAPVAAPAEAPAPQQVIFPQDTFRLIDKKDALAKNPNLIETTNRIKAGDPLMAPIEGYFAVGSKVELMALQHNVNIYHAANGKYPPFSELERMYQQSGVKLKGLYPWQAYAYDEDVGQLCILEDPDLKRKMHEEAGVPVR